MRNIAMDMPEKRADRSRNFQYKMVVLYRDKKRRKLLKSRRKAV
jgi:hypothetical protein